MSTANATSVTVKFDPTANSQQADIIGPATPTKAGVMTAAQAAALAAVVAGGVLDVTGTAPIASTGGPTPDISITPATQLAAGSLSAADKTKLDGLPVGGTPTLAEGYVKGGGNGGTNNILGTAGVGMVPPLALRAPADSAVIDVRVAATDTAIASIGILGGIGAFFGKVGNAIKMIAGAGAVSSVGTDATVQAGAATGPGAHVGGSTYLTPGAGTGGALDGAAVIGLVTMQRDQAAIAGPYIFGNGGDHNLIITADGVGAVRGGTGIEMQVYPGFPAFSYLSFIVNDSSVAFFGPTGFFPQADPIPTLDLGGSDAGGGLPQSWLTVWAQRYATRVGAPLAVAGNAIAPTSGIHSVGAGLIKNITLPFAEFTGSIVLRPTAAFTYDATGNILVAAGGGLAVTARDMTATYDGSKWAMSY